MKKLLSLFLAGGAMAALSAESSPSSLTLRQAEEIALRNHPRITAAELHALAAQQNVRAVRSALFPSIFADATAVGATDPNTRVAAGGLNNPLILDRNAEGLTISQLITDFGRSSSLTASSKSKAMAENEQAQATREQILLGVNSAYFSVLGARAVLSVARQTVESRQYVLDQATTMASNKLKSELDVKFAAVNVTDAQLLLAKAQTDLSAALANLSTVLGYREVHPFELADLPMRPAQTNDEGSLVFLALQHRPELLASRYQRDSAVQFAKAEQKLVLPTISAVGAAGIIPVRDSRLNDNYAAAGVNLSLPLFSGGLYNARRHEAQYRADEAEQNLRDQENTIIRDVRVTRLNADYAFQRLSLTEQFLANARDALDLSQTKYKANLSSIVELSQAQLNATAAEIAQATARYDYLLQRALLDFEIGELQ